MHLSPDQRHIVSNGWFYAIYVGLGFGFMTPFALALGASNTFIGVLAAMPFLAMILSQFPSQVLMRLVDRRRLYLVLTIPSRFGIPLAGVLAVALGPASLPFVLVCVFFTYLLDTMSEPAWLSTIAEKVPRNLRGEFFGLRTLVESMGVPLAAVIGGIYLDLFPEGDITGFATLFAVALIFGFLASYHFQKVKPQPYKDHVPHSLKEFFTFKGHFGRFLLFCTVFSFGAAIASPFFNVFILENLNKSYTFLVLANSMAAIGRLASMVHWGRVADVVGDLKVAVISSMATALSPLLFMFITPDTAWLVFPVHFLIGVVWAGIEVTTLNLVMDFTTEQERGLRSAQFYMINSIPNVVGPVLGGVIADNLSLGVLSGIPLVFAIAVVIRVISGFVLVPLKEPRVKQHFTYPQVLRRFLEWHPAREARDSLVMIRKVFWSHSRDR